jgi:HTH-type transcriptional regulator/antitoxin HigA
MGIGEPHSGAPFTPDWRSAPGETIADLLEERGWGREVLAERLGIGRRDLAALLTGDLALTPPLAARLEEIFGAPAAFWLTREQQFRESSGE